MLHLTLRRRKFNDTCTIGQLILNGHPFCYTLEDRVRPVGAPKVPGETAIPYGYYKGRTTMSDRFKRELPILLNVPGFDGIRIHAGNSDKDTRGCILVGQTTNWTSTVGGSRAALGELLAELEKHGGLFDLEIIGEPVQG